MDGQIKPKHFVFVAAALLLSLALAGGGLLAYYYLTPQPPDFAYAFASDRNGSGDIWVMDEAGQIHNLAENPAADWDPVWSPDGTLIAFTSHRSGNSDIWLMPPFDPDGDIQPRNLTHHPAWDYSPTWSPNGQSVAFVSEREGNPEIFMQHLEGEAALRLTFNAESDRLPAWSPDGKYIAFAGVRNGVEAIYRIRPDGTDEQLVTQPPLKGTAPAWSPDSQRLAFIGWDEVNRPGIYVIDLNQGEAQQLYEGEAWLGSLSWSPDGAWLTYTSWQAGNHELYALPVAGGSPIRLTINPAWDDFLAVRPNAPFTPAPIEGVAQAAPAFKARTSHADFATGVNMADLSLAYLVNDLGFNWAKGYVNWATVEPQAGELRWVDPDNIVNAFGDQEVKILMRVQGTPAWARPPDSHPTHPPDDPADFANFLTALATRYKGQVAAYEIWNEPNLDYEWGYRRPDPVAYTELLQVAYVAIKQADPDALVISGGLATTGNGSANAYGDLDFLREMYAAGAKGHFDALGSHPYAYGHPPDEVVPDGLSLSRVVEQRQIMEANDDGNTPIWITEVGWVLQTNWDLGEHTAIGVSQEQQAEYLARTYTKVQAEWPFVEGLFLFNLDFSTVPWYPTSEPMRWYAILNPDRTPRPAYTTLREAMNPGLE
jgi:hypothetical protein